MASKKSVRIYKIDRTVPSESDVVCTYRGLEKALKGITKTYNNANRKIKLIFKAEYFSPA